MYGVEHSELLHFIQNALRANYIFKAEVEYIVRPNEQGKMEILLVDQFTGRIMVGRTYSEGLHQAIQAKEGIDIEQETRTMATVTYQNYFRQYEKLAGMTGTAKTDEDELRSIYNMRVVCVPTNQLIRRRDHKDLIYGSSEAKFNAILKRIETLNKRGQPVLVGTTNVNISEYLSERLTKIGIPHALLNAKNHAREAEIISKAGTKDMVVISTNMAGRGTDIKINDEVRALGGLFVIGTEKHESRRIDNQLRGRSGRQGDIGYSRFYLSTADEVMTRFSTDKLKAIFSQMGPEPIRSRLLRKAFANAQKRIEGLNYDTRKNILEYDNVAAQQREVIYRQRDEILLNQGLDTKLSRMMKMVISKFTQDSLEKTPEGDVVNYEKLMKGIGTITDDFYLTHEEVMNASFSGLNNLIYDR